VFLHKPIKTATLFGTITETPAYARYSWNTYLKGPLGRLRELCSLQLQGKEAYLIANNSSEPLWTTSIHLHDTSFCPLFAEDRVEREFNTLFELLRLTGRDRVRDAERKWEPEWISDSVTHTLVHPDDLQIDRRHLMALVREEDCDELVARVGSRFGPIPSATHLDLEPVCRTGSSASRDLLQPYDHPSLRT
jgi:hypothetical protein